MKIKFTNKFFLKREKLPQIIMRTFLFLCFTTVFSFTPSKILSQNAKIKIDTDMTISVAHIFEIIRQQADYKFVYSDHLIVNASKVKLKKGIILVKKLLKRVLSPIGCTFEFTDNETVIVKRKNKVVLSDEQQKEIKGTVKDKNGEPLPGANIIEKGTTNGTETDFDGNFTLKVADENAVLVVSYLGFATREIIVGKQTAISITLVEDAAAIDEVVLTGYGSALSKEKLTGAISQISQGDFEKQPIFRIDEAIQGRVAGVVVNQNNGAPGRGFRIRVRGTNSITSGNDPLYVVDGVIGVDISVLNPSDIQSINILKDAVSLAIYGNQGSNGVVIINTKKGKYRKSQLSYDMFTTFGGIINTVPIITGSQINALQVAQGNAPTGTSNTDWQDAIYRNSTLQNHNLSYTGGSDNLNYYVSANYVDQEGLVINSDYKRYGIRANLNTDLSDKLKVGLNLNVNREDSHNTNLEDNRIGGLQNNIFTEALAISSAESIDFSGVDEANQRANALVALMGLDDNRLKNTIFANLSMGYNLAKNLTLSISGGIINTDEIIKSLIPATGAFNPNTAKVTRGNQHSFSWQNINKLAYSNTFGNHTVSVELLAEQRQRLVEYTTVVSTGFSTLVGGAYNLQVAGNNRADARKVEDRRLISYFGRVNYSFVNKYFLTGIVRADKTSVFPNNKTGTFYGIGLAWDITNEKFMNSQNIFDQFKLRLGWGQTGNQNIPSFSTLSSLDTNVIGYPVDANNNDLGGYPVGIAAATRLASPNLKWETTNQLNIGLDLAFFSGNLEITLDYYNKTVKNLLLDVPQAKFTGTNFQLQNIGEISNKGFEFGLQASPIVSKDDDGFIWDVSVNVSTNKNKVTKLFGDIDFVIYGDAFKTFSSSRAEVGQPIGAFNGRIYEGVNPTNGEPIYTDDPDDKGRNITTIGDPNPDYTFGINNTFSYKGFDINFFINGSQGNDILNVQRAMLTRGDNWVSFGTHTDILRAWTPTNTDTDIARNGNNDVTAFSTQFVEDGSFIRLKNVSLGYNFNSKGLEKIGITKARLYISGQNLVTITEYSGLDPELSAARNTTSDTFSPGVGAVDNAQGVDWGSYPLAKTFTLGLNITF